VRTDTVEVELRIQVLFFTQNFFFPLKNKSAFIQDFSEGVTDLSPRKREDVNISF